MPPGEGGPNNLKGTRAEQKESTLLSAKTILAELLRLELDLSEASWKVAKAAVDPDGASWRATYRDHVSHLFAAWRDPTAKGGLTEAQAAALRDERDRALLCVDERDAEIKLLKLRIAELEAEAAKLGRGTKARRRRRPRQDRQTGAEETGSD